MTLLRRDAGGETRDGWIVAAIALGARLVVVVWAAPRFPPAGDGVYYDTLARRLAAGEGYTWLWPDGAVTNVAHYPVGYPAILAAAYVALGARPVAAMIVGALFGAAMAFAVQRLMRGGGSSRRAAIGAALAVALHPALLPYTAAVMTEGIAAALLVLAVASLRARFRRVWVGWALAGLAFGVAALVRPQCIAFAPLLGMVAPSSPATWKTRARAALVVSAVALSVCVPWTARNCVAMHRCAFVSVNGGWNLLIGAQTTNGAWQAVAVPEACRTVWDEAAKDDCFARAARGEILAAPLAWIARAPAKLAVTFDYFGAGPWYLHEANPSAFDERAKVGLGTAEAIVSYVVLLLALVHVARADGPRRWLRQIVAGGGVIVAALLVHGVVAYAALAIAIAAFGPRWLARAPLVLPATAIVLVLTMATHAVFFGAGRYGLVAVPFVTALAFLVTRPARCGAIADGTSAGSTCG